MFLLGDCGAGTPRSKLTAAYGPGSEIMCESKVYLATTEGEKLVLQDVTSVKPEGDGYRLITLFGEETHVRGRLREIDLLKHRVVVEPLPDDSS